MNPKNTWLWILAAAMLFAGIFTCHRLAPKKEIGPERILPGLNPARITSVEVIPANQRAIHAERTNDSWQLSAPVAYPARGTNIGILLAALEQLTPAAHVSAPELKSIRDMDEQFGFNPPQITLVLQPGDMHIQIGKRNATGDGLFIKVVGVDEIFLADAELARFIPASAEDWRETTLVDFSKLNFDRLILSIAGKNLELLHNPTNQLWRMMPMDVRADGEKIQAALGKLQGLQVVQFVTDDPKADLDGYGLQTPEFSVTFKSGTNTALSLSFGKNPTNDTGKIFARRNDEKSVVTVAKDLLEPLRAPPENFRDRFLLTPTGPLAAIEIHARENFTLFQTNGSWRVAPQNYAADTAQVSALLSRLGGMQIAQFVKDVAVAQSLPEWGLANPAYQLIIHASVTNGFGVTNQPVAEMEFGTNQDEIIFARRTDEKSVYGLKLAEFRTLPQTALQLRNRRIWNFTENEVAAITVQQNGKTLQMNRRGTNLWSFAAGSQGMLNEFAVEETAHRLGELEAEAWVQRGDQHREKFGFKSGGQRITVTLKSGEKVSLDLGDPASLGSPYAMVTQDDGPWIFELSPILFQYVQLYLTIAPGAP